MHITSDPEHRYVAGALLGGYPLAQGSVFLLLKRRTARILTAVSLPFLAAAAVAVVLSPVDLSALETHRPSGAVLSAWRYFRSTAEGSGARALGNASIAFGAILPGIGGSMAKAGIVEALYVGEFVGLLFIWAGYAFCVRAPAIGRLPARARPPGVATCRPSSAHQA